MEHDARSLLSTLKKIVEEMKKAYRAVDLFQSKVLDTEFHQSFLKYSDNRYLIQSYGTIGHSVEALRYRFMDTAVYRNRAFDEHQKILELLTSGNIAKAGDILADHISRTKQFHARVNWSAGRSHRKDYKFTTTRKSSRIAKVRSATNRPSRAFSLTVPTVEILSTWLFLNEKPHWLLPVCIDNERKCSNKLVS